MQITPLTPPQLQALEDEVKDIVLDASEEGAEYAEEFARYAAQFAAAALIDPAPDAVERFEAQVRAVAETVREISDQARDRVILRLSGAIQIVSALARAAL